MEPESVERVHLQNFDYVAHQQLNTLIAALRDRKKIVVIAGAGISAAADIPTFDKMTAADRYLFSFPHAYQTADSIKRWHELLCDLNHRITSKEPTQFHRLLATVAEEGRLMRLYTQNIDGLENKLGSLKANIPLKDDKPWPKTIQLHGNISTVECSKEPLHINSFDPKLFGPKLSFCAECSKEVQQSRTTDNGRRRSSRAGEPGWLRPRISMYQEPVKDESVISKIIRMDTKSKPDAVIVVGTGLKVTKAEKLVQDMCRSTRDRGGITIWINTKAPKLNYFDLVVLGDCEKVAIHASSWWLKQVPSALSDGQIQLIQEKCNLFIARSVETALSRAFSEAEKEKFSDFIQQKDIISKIQAVMKDGQPIFISRSEMSKKITQPDPQKLPSQSLDVFPKLPACWESDMSRRLDQVHAQGSKTGQKRAFVTKCTQLGYREENVHNSLWRLKPGQELNDEVLNTYLELVQRRVPNHTIIAETGILNLKPDRPWKRCDELIKTGVYSIFMPIHFGNHWTFAVLTSKKKDSGIHWQYFDSMGGRPPRHFVDWLFERFKGEDIKEAIASPNPQQINSVDCGLFVLLGIRLISVGRSHLSQAQSNVFMPRFRQRVLAELLAQTLDPSRSDFDNLKLREAHTGNIVPQLHRPSRRVNDQNTFSGHMGGHAAGIPRTPTSKLIASPSEVIDIDSSDSLFESEHDSVQPSTSTVGNKNNTPQMIANSFAQQSSIVQILSAAVLIERNSLKRAGRQQDVQLADLWAMISTEKRSLQQRYMHYEFSRQFWIEMQKLGRGLHQRGPVPKSIIGKLRERLGVDIMANWNCILQLARRASIWTELTDIFKNELDHPSVVLCAVSDTTSALERMSMTNRRKFLEVIRSRLKEPGDKILSTLKAATGLYCAVIYRDLPLEELRIESIDKGTFEEIMSFGSR